METAHSKDDWSSVLDAVKAFVATDQGALSLPLSARSQVAPVGRIASARSVALSIPSSDPSPSPDADVYSIPNISTDELDMMRDTSEELEVILHVLGNDFPAILSETLLLAEEERAVREKAVAELDVLRRKWKADVEMLTEIITKKNETISNLQKLVFPSSRVGITSDPVIIARKLSEAESEINRLHELIESQHSAR